MKLKVLSALLASAFAGVATTASAGVIQASYKNYAAEVFGDNTVTLTAPTINYALAQPLSGTATNPNSFQISWTLSSGTWNSTPLLTAIALADPANNNQLNPTAVVRSPDNKTITATFTLNTGVNYTTGSQIVLGTTGAANVATLTGVGTILGAPAANGCGNDIAQINVSVKLTNAAGNEFESNFTQAPLSNTTPIVQSAVALSVTATSSANYAGAKETSRVNVLNPVLGKLFTSDADVTAASNTVLAGSPVSTTLNLGRVNIANKATLFDLDGSTAYSVLTAGFGTNPASSAGIVETNGLTVNVGGNFLVDPTATFYASLAADCSTTYRAGTIAANGLSATVSLLPGDMAGLQAVGPPIAQNPLYLCYNVTTANAKQIPVGQFSVTGGSLTKYASSKEAANPVCPAAVYNLVSNGVRVDVRNYLPQVVRAASGWYSVIRVINTDAQQTVSPTAQALLANGTLGATISLAQVPSVDNKTGAFLPNEVRYYTSTAIDAGLVAANNGVVYGANDVGGNARLRITAPSSSIRVQNYNFNPSNANFFEASAAQGDDGSIDTTPTTVQNTTQIRADGQNK